MVCKLCGSIGKHICPEDKKNIEMFINSVSHILGEDIFNKCKFIVGGMIRDWIRQGCNFMFKYKDIDIVVSSKYPIKKYHYRLDEYNYRVDILSPEFIFEKTNTCLSVNSLMIDLNQKKIVPISDKFNKKQIYKDIREWNMRILNKDDGSEIKEVVIDDKNLYRYFRFFPKNVQLMKLRQLIIDANDDYKNMDKEKNYARYEIKKLESKIFCDQQKLRQLEKDILNPDFKFMDTYTRIRRKRIDFNIYDLFDWYISRLYDYRINDNQTTKKWSTKPKLTNEKIDEFTKKFGTNLKDILEVYENEFQRIHQEDLNKAQSDIEKLKTTTTEDMKNLKILKNKLAKLEEDIKKYENSEIGNKFSKIKNLLSSSSSSSSSSYN